MSPPTRPKHGPAREDLMQIESKHCRHPHWHLATRAEFEAKAKLENKDSADRPHAYGLVDTRGDAFGKYRAYRLRLHGARGAGGGPVAGPHGLHAEGRQAAPALALGGASAPPGGAASSGRAATARGRATTAAAASA
eukprot:CAMPEP_0176269478 /NCGR_PEP_ID=MMETSP0121_2-20121125/44211_1 /TAXON_ID=160619 /ORGANISM="Kryptoperidinium foliaceum, Strain CCMP 1326" /LENGTH=136 /DNA_ID=CAMNT_0017609605 /DNA_START=126 /DNA_END=531 /DNA_ORIENTATION=+